MWGQASGVLAIPIPAERCGHDEHRHGAAPTPEPAVRLCQIGVGNSSPSGSAVYSLGHSADSPRNIFECLVRIVPFCDGSGIAREALELGKGGIFPRGRTQIHRNHPCLAGGVPLQGQSGFEVTVA
jgi:hypothetical protein